MAYEKQEWVDGVTPISADRLNHMEQGIAEKAEKGDNGFPTQQQWEQLLQRVEALENQEQTN